MNKQYEMVKKFHTAVGVEMPKEPTILDVGSSAHTVDFYAVELEELHRAMKESSAAGHGGEVLKRAIYSLEELIEFMRALTLEGQLDAMLDQIYFDLGTLSLMGVKPEIPFGIVAGANLGKILPDGTVLRDPVTKKIMKPPGWEETFKPEPLLIKEIEQQRRTANCTTCNGESLRGTWMACPDCE